MSDAKTIVAYYRNHIHSDLHLVKQVDNFIYTHKELNQKDFKIDFKDHIDNPDCLFCFRLCDKIGPINKLFSPNSDLKKYTDLLVVAAINNNLHLIAIEFKDSSKPSTLAEGHDQGMAGVAFFNYFNQLHDVIKDSNIANFKPNMRMFVVSRSKSYNTVKRNSSVLLKNSRMRIFQEKNSSTWLNDLIS
ncbi:MAG: hypothetical protein QM523_05810 [Candidatus Pacebacteria bacterium]|nr:hypothetical protein [Candidatus Paceibacterota bacterium]